MNDYKILLLHQQDVERGKRNWRSNEQFVEEIARSEVLQPKKRHFSFRFPQFSRLRLYRASAVSPVKNVKEMG